MFRGVSLTDLTFIEDGNPDFVEGPEGTEVINFAKRRLVFEVIQNFLDYQNTAYNFLPIEPVQTLLKYLPYDTEKEQFDLSLQWEPRNAEATEIA